MFHYDSYYPRSVLPPIPTDMLTTADIPDLITRTRDAMLAVLHELSDGPSESPQVGATTPTELTPLLSEPTMPPNSSESKDGSGGETEASEDDGVLVDRPL
jgi:hypothetical protein